MKKGLLLINLGTPDNPTPSAVRRYLRAFLSDERVITLPAPLRYLLLYAFILPFRPRQASRAYQSIWTEAGSPLLYHSVHLADKLQKQLGASYEIALGMCYGNPDLSQAMAKLKYCEHLTILPLYPQYASSSTGAALTKAMKILSRQSILPALSIIRDFYRHPAFIDAQAAQIKPYLPNHEYVLFSYHGVPENHILQGPCQTICAHACSNESPLYSGCYRAQCLHTTKLLAKTLNLTEQTYTTSFQSRLGRTPWIQPYTDEVLPKLAAQGIKKLAVTCPAFVADCLETLEEIGIRAKKQWLQLGGEQFTLIPCLNDNALWVKGIQQIIDQPPN